jgi:hypothetical protein
MSRNQNANQCRAVLALAKKTAHLSIFGLFVIGVTFSEPAISKKVSSRAAEKLSMRAHVDGVHYTEVAITHHLRAPSSV